LDAADFWKIPVEFAEGLTPEGVSYISADKSTENFVR